MWILPWSSIPKRKRNSRINSSSSLSVLRKLRKTRKYKSKRSRNLRERSSRKSSKEVDIFKRRKKRRSLVSLRSWMNNLRRHCNASSNMIKSDKQIFFFKFILVSDTEYQLYKLYFYYYSNLGTRRNDEG